MKVEYHRLFKKHYRQRIAPYSVLEQKFQERSRLFLYDPRDPVLKDHALTGDKGYYRAFWVTGDVRVVYRIVGDTIWFYDIGTHNQVY